MPEEISTRASINSVTIGMRQTNSQSAAPPNKPSGLGERPSNTRAPVQVTAKAVNRTALARSIEMRSDTEPYMPNSTTDAARRRCALPHQATAMMPEFWTQANSSSRPSMAST